MNNDVWLLPIIKQINTEARNRCNRDLKECDVTTTQLEVLFYLFDHQKQSVNQRDIESALHLSNPTIVSILDRLEGKGFIKRVVSDNDRRNKHIILTEFCEEIKIDMYERRKQNEENLLQGLTAQERKTLKELLAKVIEKITES